MCSSDLIGPFVTSLFMEIKIYALFLFIAIVSSLLAIIGIYFRIKYPQITPKEEKSEFMPISASAPIGTDIASQTIEQNKENTVESFKHDDTSKENTKEEILNGKDKTEDKSSDDQENLNGKQ